MPQDAPRRSQGILVRLASRSAVADSAALARLPHVSRARITQIMSLLLLAPDIQEGILFLPRTDGRRAPIRERLVRRICAVLDWRRQRRVCDYLVGSRDSGTGYPIRRLTGWPELPERLAYQRGRGLREGQGLVPTLSRRMRSANREYTRSLPDRSSPESVR